MNPDESPKPGIEANSVRIRSAALMAMFCLACLPGCRSPAVKPKVGASAARMTILAFDRGGKPLDFEGFAAISKGSREGAYDTDVFLDPKTLAVVDWYPISTRNSLEGIALPAGPVALGLNWPSARGYSFLVIDNQGRGFRPPNAGGDIVVNFSAQAAVDLMRRLDKALAARPDYRKSGAFEAAYSFAVELSLSLITRGSGDGPTESERAVVGWKALDQIARAYDLLLAEYGAQRFASAAERDSLWIGLTIEGAGMDASADRANVDRAAALCGTQGMIRFVFDSSMQPAAYADIVAYAKKKGLYLLGEPVDSIQDSELSTKDCIARFKAFIDALPEIDVWEVGNEVNGGWTSSSIAQRIKIAADYAKSKGKKTLLTLFYQIGTGSGEIDDENNSQDCTTDTFSWIAAKLSPEVRAMIDYATLSLYPEQAPIGLAFDLVMERLAAEFPASRIGVGELGYWCQEDDASNTWWYADEKDMLAARDELFRQYYRACFAYPAAFGGGFWWYFATTSSAPDWTDAMAKSLKDLRGLR